MSSSAFVRRQPALRAVDLGTRPGLHGQVLISSGLAGLDRLLGGGLPLGCLVLLLEDAHSQQAANLAKCFLGEGLCCRHSLALVTAQQLDAAGAAALVPPEHAKGSSTSSSGGGGSGGATQASPPAAPAAAPSAASSTGAAAAAPDDGLRIAWQYRKYIQNQQRAEAAAGPLQQQQQDRSSSSSSSSKVPSASSSSSSSSSSAAKAVAAGIGREWCHHFDLTRGVTLEQLAASKLELHFCVGQPQQQHSGGSSTAGPVEAAAAAAEAFLARFQPKGPIPVPSRDPASIGRLVLQSLGGPEWWPDATSSSSWTQLEAAMLSAMARIRLAVQDASAAAVITCPAGLFSESFQTQLQHLADAVLCVQSLADNTDVYTLLPDATSAAALLEVRRLPSLGLLRQRHVEESLHVVRTKRRSISVGVLDLVPPESLAAAGGDAGGASKPAAGGGGCSAALAF